MLLNGFLQTLDGKDLCPLCKVNIVVILVFFDGDLKRLLIKDKGYEMTKKNVLDYLSRNKDYIKKKYGIIKIGLLGSYARDDESEQSDIDIVIEIVKSKKNIHTFFAFRRELEEALGKKIDLGLESSLKPIVRESIQKEIFYV